MTIAVTAPDGSTINFPDGTPENTINGVMTQHFGKSEATAPEAESSVGGSIKALGAGLGEGIIGLAGMPGDIVELGTHGINYLAGTSLKNRVPLPTSENIQKTIESVTGPFYKPQGATEKLLNKGGSFLPAVIGGPEALATKLASRVALPAIGSQIAGSALEGSDAKPYGEVAGALTGAVLGHKLTAPKPPDVSGSIEGVLQSGKTQFQELNKVEFTPGYAENVSNQTQAALRREKFNDKTAGKTFAIVEELKTPAGPSPAASGSIGEIINPGAKPGAKGSISAAEGLSQNTGASAFEDFQAARTQLQKLAGNYHNDPIEGAAATTAIKQIDRHLANIPQSALRNADKQEFATLLGNARADYASGKTAERIMQKTVDNPALQAAAANSGRNVGNITRQKQRQILTSAKGTRGVTEGEQEMLAQGVRGTLAENVLRSAGHYLGGGGGLGAAPGMFGAYLATGNPLTAFVPPIAGYLAQKAANKIATNQAEKVVREILRRSPTYKKYLAGLPTPPSLTQGILSTALLGSKPQGLLNPP